MDLDIDDLRKKERVIDLKLKIVKMMADQDYTREQKVCLGWVYRGKKRRRKKYTTDEAVKPDVLEDTENLVERFETARVFAFPPHAGNDGNEVELDEQLYGRWGAIHKAFFKIWKALRKAPYVIDMLDLMRVENPGLPVRIKPKFKFADNPDDKPFSIPVPRSRGATRAIEYFDYIVDHKEIPARITFPAELPISAEEFKTLVHGLEFVMLAPIGRTELRVSEVNVAQNGWSSGNIKISCGSQGCVVVPLDKD